MSGLKIITTRDGSHSLLNEQLNETYHSVHGAVQESKHVFIEHGLNVLPQKDIQLLEIGFGTGLNAWLTLQEVLSKKFLIHYTTLETFPVEKEIWSRLNYASEDVEKAWFEKLHMAKWNSWEEISPVFHLRKVHTTIQEATLEEEKYDLIYFDAFAPNKQPEMWEESVLQKVAKALKKEGILVTYCAKGQVKRDLKKQGLEVETLPGPPGKREMVRARK